MESLKNIINESTRTTFATLKPGDPIYYIGFYYKTNQLIGKKYIINTINDFGAWVRDENDEIYTKDFDFNGRRCNVSVMKFYNDDVIETIYTNPKTACNDLNNFIKQITKDANEIIKKIK